MLVYTLPYVNAQVFQYLNITIDDKLPPKHVSESLSHYLQDIKNQIREHEREWDIYKKYTNTYEYIHTIHPYKKKAVSKYRPLSRSFFKMVELIHELHLLPFSPNPRDPAFNTPALPPIRTFHLAEGPRGFIEAVVKLRKNPADVYVGMTIQDLKNDGTAPTWKKSEYFLCSNPNVIIENGRDNTGNILSIDNFEYCYEKYRSSMDFITADGGFDFSADFNNQELQIAELLFAQIAFAMVMQKPGGNFVLKVFDCFYGCTNDLLYLLSSCYKTVYITKPRTSRSGNSEKYVVCKGFLYYSVDTLYTHLRNAFIQMLRITSSPHAVTPTYILRFLTVELPLCFNVKMEEYNSVFGYLQIENIHNTIMMIERNPPYDHIIHITQHNMRKSIDWCVRYNIPYNPLICNNMFIQNETHATDSTGEYYDTR
jgi:23S rRNA U2552 (ribose-2'-O)-methylase RlmE/FtsJ